ncbi:hypothetical protein BP6252_13160 [Coleophoma cylindrospora]|uniref:Uncharacterized protein n=1 Tax=Coleophoma cylindrospora TaxID=1849047 RepID=A0A3D8QB19_9HELO|nr:hypothetical protein BP6252_13160 [Coleophoma cylindrospora]
MEIENDDYYHRKRSIKDITLFAPLAVPYLTPLLTIKQIRPAPSTFQHTYGTSVHLAHLRLRCRRPQAEAVITSILTQLPSSAALLFLRMNWRGRIVIMPELILDKQPYTFSGQEQRHEIYSPSSADHTLTQTSPQEGLELWRSYGDRYKADEAGIRSQIQQAQQYDRHLGLVKATSGLVKPSSDQDYRLDWALIECCLNDTQERRYTNKHRQVDPKSFLSIPVPLTEEVRSNLEDWTEPNHL